MEWDNLKNNRCPKDDHLLRSDEYQKMRFCSYHSCRFKITFKRFDEIVSGMYRSAGRFRRANSVEEEDNQAGLNNL